MLFLDDTVDRGVKKSWEWNPNLEPFPRTGEGGVGPKEGKGPGEGEGEITIGQEEKKRKRRKSRKLWLLGVRGARLFSLGFMFFFPKTPNQSPQDLPISYTWFV